jgi:antitoxin HicB
LAKAWRIPIVLEPQPEGGYVVSSPALPGLNTEGETEVEAVENAWEALQALLIAYQDIGQPLPLDLPANVDRKSVSFDYAATA